MKKFLAALSLGALAVIAHPVSAQLINSDTASNFTNDVGTAAGFQSLTIGFVIATIIQASLSLLALIFMILAVLAGFRWMTAAGNEEQITKAQDTLKAAIVGLVIVLAAWSITYFVLKYLPFSGGSSTTQTVTSG